jgi:hypothetical protein
MGREASPKHVCAWCERELDIRPGSVRGVLATNWGMCSSCLSDRLAALMAVPLQTPYKVDPTRPKAARRLHEAA